MGKMPLWSSVSRMLLLGVAAAIMAVAAAQDTLDYEYGSTGSFQVASRFSPFPV